jgi:hypothetical protein
MEKDRGKIVEKQGKIAESQKEDCKMIDKRLRRD